MRGLALPVALVAAVVLGVLGFGGGGEDSHRVSFVMPRAADLISGQHVRAAGQKVGSIRDVQTLDGGHSARVELELTNDKVWPLPPDTRVKVRFGGAVALAARYVQLDRGIATGTPIPDGGSLPRANVDLPVEFDQLFNTFGAHTRQNLRATVDATGRALDRARPQLRRSLDVAPGVVQQAQGLSDDLGADESALHELVRSTDRVVHAANAADPGIEPLIADAATTFQALGERETQLKQLLAELPATLGGARRTLARADTTLASASSLARRLAPGIEQLIDITPPLNSALRAIQTVGPQARGALATTRRAAPDIATLLSRATTVLPTIATAGAEGAKQLRCIRPYAPEIGGMVSTWSGFVADGDHKDKYARLFFGTYPFGNDVPLTVPQAAKVMPSAFTDWAFPRPPGANAGKPWYQPECGVTADGQDPQKDPEAINFDPFSKKLVDTLPPEGGR